MGFRGSGVQISASRPDSTAMTAPSWAVFVLSNLVGPLRFVSPPPACGRRPAFPLSGPAAPGLRSPWPRPPNAAGGECRISASRPPSNSQRRPTGGVCRVQPPPPSLALGLTSPRPARRDRERSRRPRLVLSPALPAVVAMGQSALNSGF